MSLTVRVEAANRYYVLVAVLILTALSQEAEWQTYHKYIL